MSAVVPARPRRRQIHVSWRLMVGLVVLATGLAMVGYVGWQFWGTTYVSHRHQREVIEDLRDSWGEREAVAHTRFGAAAAYVEIPRFGAHYRVPVLEGTSEEVLSAGFGHFARTAKPGEVGNYALAAHRVTHGEPLRQMPSLRAGDIIRIVTRSTTYTYRLTTGGTDLVVPMTATWIVGPHPVNPDPGGVQPLQEMGERMITLTTCAELFHTDQRMVAFGVLAGSRATSGSGAGGRLSQGG